MVSIVDIVPGHLFTALQWRFGLKEILEEKRIQKFLYFSSKIPSIQRSP
jgi:hypothetical protein